MLPQAASGRLRTIAVLSRERVSFAPDLRHRGERLAGFEAVQWYGLVGPLPHARFHHRERMNREMNALAGRRGARAVVDANDGAIAAPHQPEGFGAPDESENRHWRDVIRRAGITGGN